MKFPFTPFYSTSLGHAYLGDSLSLMRKLPSESVNLILTSPLYALHFKKEYGNKSQAEYVAWFMGFAEEFFRLLRPDGSLVIDLGGSWQQGRPTRSLYHFELLIALCKETGFHLAQEFYWHNPAKLPSPAEWVTVRKIRVKVRWLRFFGQNLSVPKWCRAVYAYAAVGRAGTLSQYTRSGVRPSSARCGLS
ncbi:MAG: hypothetical protein HRU82_11465 [Nitrospira sp.]|nr:MAG: hypothetical protein HRU82_11465 [Nitrospira sp.]